MIPVILHFHTQTESILMIFFSICSRFEFFLKSDYHYYITCNNSSHLPCLLLICCPSFPLEHPHQLGQLGLQINIKHIRVTFVYFTEKRLYCTHYCRSIFHIWNQDLKKKMVRSTLLCVLLCKDA